MEEAQIIQCNTYPRVYFRNARARFWADNSVRNNETATQYVAHLADFEKINFLIVHPEEDPNDVPKNYEGKIIRFCPLDSSKKRIDISN